MENEKSNNNNEFNSLIAKYEELSKTVSIIYSAIQYKRSENIIISKVENEKNAITFGINSVNRKVLENIKKYNQIENRLNEIMERYESNLRQLAELCDADIISNHLKILEEEKKNISLMKQIDELILEENKAKSKVDNSDDEIREKICNLQDEITKNETKISRIKMNVKRKAEEKELTIGKAMESKDQQLQRNIKGPRVFSKATRFFLGRINPCKTIEKNVFSEIINRIECYENEEKKKIKEKDKKYLKADIVNTINEIMNTKEEYKPEEEKKTNVKRKNRRKKTK